MKHEHTHLAQELRKNPTKEEARLWYQFLRCYPLRFRRQFQIGRYIVDFYCAKARLVVELDGSQHCEPDAVAYDKIRTQFLEEKGLYVLRLSNLDVDMCNLHAGGASAMMQAALEGLTREDGTRPLLIGVTQLTSTSQQAMEEELLIPKPIDQVVMHYAKNAMTSGLDGVVCSPLEAGKVKEVCGTSFLTVTPGVRFADGDVGDQVRVTTPEKARELGSDYIVVGRPITAAPDPRAAYLRCCKEFLNE